MKIVCLTEGGQEFGYGHIIRCVSIAQAFEEFSWQVDFVIDADHDVTDLLAGFAHRICNWRKGINLDDYSLVIVDSYAANYAELITVIKGKPVLFFDDYNRSDYPTGSWIVNACPKVSVEFYESDVGILTGTKYLPLRKSFWDIKPSKTDFSSNINEIFVMFGGGDTQNFVPTTLFKIFELFPQAAVNLVQGKHSKSLKESFSLSECNERLKVEVQPDINKLLMMMMKSDLAISAAGQTLQELARLGIPTVGVQIAENQKNNILGWASLGAVIPVMNFEVEDFKFALTRAINSLRSKSQRQKISVRASNLVDGQGARRIASFVSKMYRYRNSPCI